MTFSKPGKKVASSRLIIDSQCAFAASLCASCYTFLIYLLKPHKFDVLTYGKFLLMALAAYFTVALICHKFWTGGLRSRLPNWILISVFGSTLFVVIRLLPAVLRGWSGPTVTEPSLIEYIAMEASASRSVIILLSFITLPITALIYYSDSIIRMIKHWHNGTESPLSIQTTSTLKK